MESNNLKSLADIYKDTPFVIDTRKTINPRSLLIEKFVKEINQERKGTKFNPVTGAQIAVKVSHMNMESLQYLYSICLSSKNRKVKTDQGWKPGSFSKCFYLELKIK